MLSGPRLDPFSARLHAIHQKRRTLNPQPPHEEHDAQGFDAEEEVGERADANEPALDLAPVKAVDTGCDDCGMGSDFAAPVNADPMIRMSEEIAAMKARIAALEARIADLEDGDAVVYRSV